MPMPMTTASRAPALALAAPFGEMVHVPISPTMRMTMLGVGVAVGNLFCVAQPQA